MHITKKVQHFPGKWMKELVDQHGGAKVFGTREQGSDTFAIK